MSSTELSETLENQKESLEAFAEEQKQKALADLTEQLVSEKNSALESLQESLEQQSREALECALGAKTAEAEDALASIKADHSNEVSSLRDEHSAAMSKLKEELTQTAADEKARLIELERSSTEAKLSEAKVAFETQAIKDRECAVSELKQALQASFEERLQLAKESHQQEKIKLLFEQKQVVEKSMGVKTKDALKEQEMELRQFFVK